MKIDELDLSVRAYNVLKRAGIDTVEQLQRTSDDDLQRIRNMGVHTMKEIREKVAYVSTMTNADRIRAMSDEELAAFIQNIADLGTEYSSFCQNRKECSDLLECDELIPNEWCMKCRVEWLRQPAENREPATMVEYEKQHSGLFEEE